MKSTLIGIGLAIVIVAAGIVGLGYYLGLFGTRAPSAPSPSPTTYPSSPAPTITPTVAPTLPPGSTTSATAKVNFQLAVTNVAGTGLTRTITAQITNTGSADAHNTWAKVEAFSQGQRIQLSGQDFLRVDIGTIKAGSTITKQVSLTFTIADGLRIQQNGAQFLLTVNSDEGSQTLNYNYP